MNTTNRVYKWSAIDKVGNMLITFAGVMILTRVLGENARADFGLVAIVGIFTAIAQNFSSCGLSDGLIFKKNPTADDYSTVFVFNASMGAFFCAIFIAISGLVAEFFGHIELKYIMCVLGVCFFFQTLSYVQETRMRKHLNLRAEALVRLSASLTANALGVFLAVKGYGYWALVSTQIFLSFFIFLYYLIASRWFPRFRFSRQSFHEMFHFGLPLMMAYIGNIAAQRVNSFVLGKYSTLDAGVYSQAQKLEEAPFGMVQQTFNSPFFAVLQAENNIDRRHGLVLNMYQILLLAYVSLGMLLMLISTPAILFIYGDYWKDAIPVFRLLILWGVASGFKYYFQTILKSHGHPETIRNLSFFEIGLQMVLLGIVLIFRGNILWIAATQVAATGMVTLIYAHRFLRYEGLNAGVLVRLSLRLLAIPFAAFAVTGLLYQFWHEAIPSLLDCIITAICFVCTLAGSCRLINPLLFSTIVRRATEYVRKKRGA